MQDKQTKLVFCKWHATTQSPSCRHFCRMWVKMEHFWNKQNKTACPSLSQKEGGYRRWGYETNPRIQIKSKSKDTNKKKQWIQFINFQTVP